MRTDGERLGPWFLPSVRGLPIIPLPGQWGEEEPPFLLKTEAVISKLNPSAQELFGELLENPEFRERVGQFKEFLDLRPGERPTTREEFRSQLVGAIFELLSFNFLRKRTASTEVLFSPRETRDLYAYLYPDKKRGVTVPDGLLFNLSRGATRIVGVCEYSSTRLMESKKNSRKLESTMSLISLAILLVFLFGGRILGRIFAIIILSGR